MYSEKGFITLGKYCVVSPSLDESLVNAIHAESVTRCTYIQWLGAEAVRISYVNQQGSFAVLAISREMIVKRVANTLDGSHPSAGGGGDANRFDAAVHNLLQYGMGGLPLPYFILLKIAQDILDVAPKLLGLNEVEKAT